MNTKFAKSLLAIVQVASATQLLDLEEAQSVSQDYKVAPIALLHGVNSGCNNVGGWIDMIKQSVGQDNVVKCVEIGDGKTTSKFVRMQWQADVVCHKLHNDPDYAGKEINLLGISQGGLIARTVIETCPDLNINVFYTFGSPHQGVSVYEKCNHWYCPFVNHILGYLAEFVIVQDWGAPPDYYRPWWNLDRFYSHSIFLPEINNELETKNADYKTRLSSVKQFGLWMWEQDRVVVPRNSEWFGYWDDERNDIPMKEQKQYEEDWIGLRTLYESGRMWFYTGAGDHMHLEEYMIEDYLKPLLVGTTPMPSEY